MCKRLLIIALLTTIVAVQASQNDQTLHPPDIFDLEFVLDPQPRPNTNQIAYVRQSMNIMTDWAIRNIWIVDNDGDNHRPLLSGTDSYTSPRCCPTGRPVPLPAWRFSRYDDVQSSVRNSVGAV